jgi:L-fuconolactonase
MIAAQNLAWIQLTPEATLEPELLICDCHHHLWDYPDSVPENQLRHQWVRHYMLTDMLQDIGKGHNVRETVVVESRTMYRNYGPKEYRPVGQTEFAQGIAAQAATGLYGQTLVAAGIVGYVDLALGDAVAPILEAHLIAGKDRFRGIRNVLTWHSGHVIESRIPGPDFITSPMFLKGFSCLHTYHLSFDTFIFHPQLAEMAKLAKAFPDTPIILEHFGGLLGIGPYVNKREEVFQSWKQGITALKEYPNVIMKMSGLGQLLNGFEWNKRAVPPGSEELAKTIKPYFDHCIESFGVSRCMLESNYPVDRISFSYTVLWNAFKRLTKEYTKSEKAALYRDNAVKLYRLPAVEG